MVIGGKVFKLEILERGGIAVAVLTRKNDVFPHIELTRVVVLIIAGSLLKNLSCRHTEGYRGIERGKHVVVVNGKRNNISIVSVTLLECYKRIERAVRLNHCFIGSFVDKQIDKLGACSALAEDVRHVALVKLNGKADGLTALKGGRRLPRLVRMRYSSVLSKALIAYNCVNHIRGHDVVGGIDKHVAGIQVGNTSRLVHHPGVDDAHTASLTREELYRICRRAVGQLTHIRNGAFIEQAACGCVRRGFEILIAALDQALKSGKVLRRVYKLKSRKHLYVWSKQVDIRRIVLK